MRGGISRLATHPRATTVISCKYQRERLQSTITARKYHNSRRSYNEADDKQNLSVKVELVGARELARKERRWRPTNPYTVIQAGVMQVCTLVSSILKNTFPRQSPSIQWLIIPHR